VCPSTDGAAVDVQAEGDADASGDSAIDVQVDVQVDVQADGVADASGDSAIDVQADVQTDAVADASSDSAIDAGGGEPADAGSCDNGGYYDLCLVVCPAAYEGLFYRCERVTASVVRCYYSSPPCGRRPAGLEHFAHEGGSDPIAGMLAEMAFLEAASVSAFQTLARELAAHGAPRRLVRSARCAARDEVRHARVTRALAKCRGARVSLPRVVRGATRALEDIARENVVEGCVRETYGAVVATWQARFAQDPRMRAAMSTIARDEVRHSALAARVAAWACTKLSPAARVRIRRAEREAIDSLRREVAREPHTDVVRTLGMPRARDAIALVAALDHAFWS
jgi:hypothetical protein